MNNKLIYDAIQNVRTNKCLINQRLGTRSKKRIGSFYRNVNDHFSNRINTISQIDDGNLVKVKWSIIKGKA